MTGPERFAMEMSVESRESMEKAIFGSSDEDCDDAEVLSETVDPVPAQKKKRKTASGLRVRLSEKEKISIALHSQQNPHLSQQDMIKWSFHKFGMEKEVSKAAMSRLD